MYFCKHCHEIFEWEDIEKYEEPSEAWGHMVYEVWYLCPHCGEPIGETTRKIPCFECDSWNDCIKQYIETEEPICEIGCDHLEVFEEEKEFYE